VAILFGIAQRPYRVNFLGFDQMNIDHHRVDVFVSHQSLKRSHVRSGHDVPGPERVTKPVERNAFDLGEFARRVERLCYTGVVSICAACASHAVRKFYPIDENRVFLTRSAFFASTTVGPTFSCSALYDH
jgi:hypothetical protein